MSDLDAIQARLDAAGANVLIVPSGAGVQLIVGPGGRKGVTLGSISLDLRTDQPLIDLWNHAHADLVALVAELRAAREIGHALERWSALPGMFWGDTPETGSEIGAALKRWQEVAG